MTTVQITLPDALAQEAASAGLLAPEKIERILRERLRAEHIERMKSARARLAAEPLAPMTPEEITAEIDAYRTEQRFRPQSFNHCRDLYCLTSYASFS